MAYINFYGALISLELPPFFNIDGYCMGWFCKLACRRALPRPPVGGRLASNLTEFLTLNFLGCPISTE